jgi:tripartite-type tricarboxylate transporter receptor subunit TctC
MKPSRREFLQLGASAVALSLAARTAMADGFPTRLITIVVPFPAGGPADLIARLLAERMRATIGQPLIVENVAGAGGTLGVGRVARAAPDGYTLSIGQLNSHVFAGATYDLRFDLLKDLAPIALLTTNPQMLVGRKDLRAQNMQELIDWLRSNPDKGTYATPGTGSPSHVWGVHSK